ncbi:dihydrofolate reductase family protein [Mesorhizobium sp. AaZ16]|uniref:dihydrofolate reductase family protein n=1 Tax=Mesorhizobium sp. AaZ16 TaxID=3402289 RepID=UPI00374E571C
MPRLVVFNNISLDGYFTGSNGDLGWAYDGRDDPDYDAFIAGNARSGGMLLLGRITYVMMVHYWPTPAAAQNDPVVAERMNAMPKLVFSRTLENPAWENTGVSRDAVAEVRRLKHGAVPDMTVLGSGGIVAQLARQGLIDEYQFMLNPVALGAGRTLFEGMEDEIPMKLVMTRSFGNGKIFLRYEPAG